MIDYLYCVFAILCFIAGFILGQRNKEGKELIDTKKIVEAPQKITEAIETHKKERKIKKEQDKEIEFIQTVTQNIEAYDGTSNNQKEIKR